MKKLTKALATMAFLGATSTAATAAPALGAHPRLFLDDATLTSLRAKAATSGTATARALATCDDVIARPQAWSSGGYQGMGFPEPFSACALAWVIRGDQASGTAAVKYFKALLDDYYQVGDGAGGDNVVAHDSGYSMRIFAPYAAIGYDWLQNAPGVDASLLARARARFTAWTSWYSASGYNATVAGANYHAGYVVGASLIAVAQAGEAGAAGDALWNHVVDGIFGEQLLPAVEPGGVLDGGDWMEGWQYGALSVAEYALSARALRESGVELPGFARWETDLVSRTIYATTPDKTGAYIGGDSQATVAHAPVNPMTYYAAMLGDASPEAKAWAASEIETQDLKVDMFHLYAALGEASAPAAAPFPEDASTWTNITGSRTLHARSDWSADAVWMTTRCASQRVPDHMFVDAGNVVLSRGADDLIVDPSPYGSLSTLTGNAPSVVSPHLPANYQPSQGPWGDDDAVNFAWAKQTQSGIVAARCDYASQYKFQENASDVPEAKRDVIMVPYGNNNAAMIVIDDTVGAMQTGAMNLRFHTLGGFSTEGSVARSHVGDSDLVIQVASATAGAPTTMMPSVGDCFSSNRGQCNITRFASGLWQLSVTAQAARARAVTVVDAVGTGESAAAPTTTSGDGWSATELDRDGNHLAVISVPAGRSAVTYTARAGRHVVVGAPSASGKANISATASGGACAVTVTAAADGAYSAEPVVIELDDGCAISEDAQLDGGAPTTPGAGDGEGGGDDADGDGKADEPGSNGVTGGCSTSGRSGSMLLPLLLVGLMISRRRRQSV